ncbi:Protein of unknown function [Ruegeria halocynthiae]|uniref:Nucleoside-triphosphatase THEP1 n=1 Tax=Ruegeria halocynthiae TaxID=985054 RepID=A0A1H3CLA8_9RHOB|nr:DUF2478 domain-containing protein [Ruegeria halocynthiae]SDX55032.1 Protein of unknown function [Ruegeria halocynthiae]
MKLACVTSQKQGEIDRLLAELAAELESEGIVLSGIIKDLSYSAVHENGCDMSVRVLPAGPVIKITQNLGKGSDACRLDPMALTDAVTCVEQAGFQNVDLFILNKFGPEEAAGRGFCSVMGKALDHGIPVLVGVGKANKEAFLKFAGGLAQTLPDDETALRHWCAGI